MYINNGMNIFYIIMEVLFWASPPLQKWLEHHVNIRV